MSIGQIGPVRSIRSRLLILASVSLALVLSAQVAAAAVPITETGKRGIWTVADAPGLPGATCIYDLPGGMGNDLDILEARSPRVFARDRTGARDRQWVGIRVIFQRSKADGGTGGWQKVKQTELIKKRAHDDQAVGIGKRAWIAEYTGMPHFRVVAQMKWYKPGSKKKVQGSAKVRYQWYATQLSPNPPDEAMDRCLPEP